MLRGKRIITAVLAGAALSAAVGCGDGEEATISETLTRAEFVKQATAICKTIEPRSSEAFESASKQGKNFLAGSDEELTELVATAALPLYEEIIGELAALEPPLKEEAKWDAIIRRYDNFLAEAEADPAKQLEHDSFTPVGLMIEKLGIKGCYL
ncbi:MAG: hypothetical protein ACJ76B_11060 [Solirubrobacterales bacterium]